MKKVESTDERDDAGAGAGEVRRIDQPLRVDAGSRSGGPLLLASAALYFGFAGGAVWLARAAFDHGYSPPTIAIGIVVLAGLALAGLERLWPYRAAWREPQGDVRTDSLHFLVSSTTGVAWRWLNTATASSMAVIVEVPTDGVWPHAWPFVAQFVLAFIIKDFCAYWIHRALHRFALLWRFHAVHHSAPRLYWFNQMRNHPMDGLLSGLATVPVSLLGAPDRVRAALAAGIAAHSLLQHANIGMRLGPLNWVFSTPEIHRWHHSKLRQEANANYGDVTIVWDAVFGTRFLPAKREPPVETGIEDGEFPRGYVGQIVRPWLPKQVFDQIFGKSIEPINSSFERSPSVQSRAGRPRNSP